VEGETAVSNQAPEPEEHDGDDYKALLSSLDWRYQGKSVGHRTVETVDVDWSRWENEGGRGE
jgi:hypothetical protein